MLAFAGSQSYETIFKGKRNMVGIHEEGQEFTVASSQLLAFKQK